MAGVVGAAEAGAIGFTLSACERKVKMLVPLLTTPLAGPLVLRLVWALAWTRTGCASAVARRTLVVNPKSRVGKMWLLWLVASISMVGHLMLGRMPRSGEQFPSIVKLLVLPMSLQLDLYV